MERAHSPDFDGFTGAGEPFFDPSTVAKNDLPSRWTRIWKLHGSLGWSTNSRNDIIRVGGPTATDLVFPEHLKYEQTKKAPYSALFDRLGAFLSTPDTLLIATGFSFADFHVSARIDECLTANPSASLFAFQFRPLDEKSPHGNRFSVGQHESVLSRQSHHQRNGRSWLPAIRQLVIGGRFARVTGELTRLEVPRSFCWGIMYIWLDSLPLLTLLKPFLHHHQVQFREGTIGYKMNVKPTLLGHVGSVSGAAVSAAFIP